MIKGEPCIYRSLTGDDYPGIVATCRTDGTVDADLKVPGEKSPYLLTRLRIGSGRGQIRPKDTPAHAP